ncbi:hypothetical protein FND52_15090 [Atlantibacter subterranea]|uniref:hypothetical protein n=1 Tax=Atlantibacter subterraneus TaxID=255519 RepID=UPI001183D195|nr:hypothetical protein [Atlantibacter subterranea]TSJ53421.1 hypothetical protein FND52_15090 [Atlantibacter subterranea]
MVSRVWKIGLHIQRDGIRAVAVQRRREGWQLKKWWYFPLSAATDCHGLIISNAPLIQALQTLRAELPAQHHLRVAFPARRTLQRTMPLPDQLCESECQAYVTTATAKALQMAPESLFSDYRPDAAQKTLSVTAAHRQEVGDVIALLERGGFSYYALTPDACALTSFFPYAAPQIQGIAACDGEQWLWATRERWGGQTEGGLGGLAQTLSIPLSQWLCCSDTPQEGAAVCDPWRWLTWVHPPKAPDEWRFAVALGLAMGNYPI